MVVDVAGSCLAPGGSAGVRGKPASPTSGLSRLGRFDNGMVYLNYRSVV